MITTDRFLLVLVFLFTLLHNSAHALVILQYHHIADDTPFSTSTKPEVFAAHLEHLAQSGFNIVSLSEHFSQQNEGDASANALEVAITFDDAYRSIFTEAFPLLRARGWRMENSALLSDWKSTPNKDTLLDNMSGELTLGAGSSINGPNRGSSLVLKRYLRVQFRHP